MIENQFDVGFIFVSGRKGSENVSLCGRIFNEMKNFMVRSCNDEEKATNYLPSFSFNLRLSCT